MKYILLVFVVFYSCTSSNKVKDTQKVSFEQIIHKKFTGDVTLNYNKKRDVVICKEYQNPKALSNYKSKKFIIFNLSKEALVYEDSYVNGSVDWISDKKIKIIKGLGTITAEHPDGYIAYIYDIETGTRTEESSSAK